VALKCKFPAFEKSDKTAFDVLGTTHDHRLVAHNPRSRERSVAHRQEVTDTGVPARHEAGHDQQLFDLVEAHVRPKEGTEDLALELNEGTHLSA
jgi:hypothetical protein